MDESNRRKSPRLAGFDYSSSGSYFVTICSQNMTDRFGIVRDGEVELNDAGFLIRRVWQEEMSRFPGFEPDAYVLMPNHLHAIIHIGTQPNVQQASLLDLINSFKSRSTVQYSAGVRAGQFPAYDRMLWQRSFYDRILRNQQAIDSARLYISENPSRWEQKNQRP